MRSLPARDAADRGAYGAMLALSGIAFMVGNLFPVINGGLVETKGLSTAQLGYVSSLFVLAGALVVATAPLWIRRASWRLTTLAGIVLIAAGLAACIVAPGFAGIAAATGLMGIGSGLTQATVMTGLGDRPSPERAYGVSLAVQMAMQSAFVLLATHWLLPSYGFNGFLISIAGFSVAVGLCALAMPEGGRDTAAKAAGGDTRAHGRLSLLPPLLGLFAIAAFMAGILAIWFFVERIGDKAGLSPQQIGNALALSGLATIVASGLVGVIGSKLPDLAGTVAGVVVSLAGLFALGAGTAALFTLGVCAISCGWGITQPYLWGMTARLDPSRALFAANPAALGFGGAIGISLGGIIADGAGFDRMAWAAAGLFGLAVLAAWGAASLSPRLARDSGARAPR